MSGNTVSSAILLLVIGNALAIVSDVFIKLLEPGAPVFQFAFLRSLLTLVLLLPLLGQINRDRLLEGVGLHALRAHIHLAGLICMVVALTTLPLASANAVFYVAPVIVMVLSVVFMGEGLRPLSLLAVFSGFGGVLVILRPMEFNLASLSALGTAFCLATAAVMVRKLPREQSTVHKLFLSYLLMLPASLVLALLEGAPWRLEVVWSALGSAIFILGYNTSVLMAYRHVEANQVTSAEYTGLIWAIAVGWIWFGEVPDLWFFTGSLMIILPLVLIGLQRRRTPVPPRQAMAAEVTAADSGKSQPD
ncbi:Permease of the drug/metabolite transporter (DMT) superfamily [Marinobacter daqiaonensis]|uniref:Permease of the drug/metabolite transporter (DMT) superfamily n=1 Tax=Marinobacter daqiaonensis TaxID=650891 RepID=A0A1I6I9V6_9GAMM|nr:DMT family transporter [Marinobacter daqiaonensis]SFR63483.1 Permease of the drug/metabolite transporter (DMT) superfamily [Marinobacter daqiaonensis]